MASLVGKMKQWFGPSSYFNDSWLKAGQRAGWGWKEGDQVLDCLADMTDRIAELERRLDADD